MKSRNYEKVEKLFQRCLMRVLNIDLWKCYLTYVRETKSGLSSYRFVTCYSSKAHCLLPRATRFRDGSSQRSQGGAISYLVVKSHNGFRYCKKNEVYFTTLLSQNKGRKIAFYRMCCFPNCKKTWWIKLLSYVIGVDRPPCVAPWLDSCNRLVMRWGCDVCSLNCVKCTPRVVDIWLGPTSLHWVSNNVSSSELDS